jgi:hypothetical protein
LIKGKRELLKGMAFGGFLCKFPINVKPVSFHQFFTILAEPCCKNSFGKETYFLVKKVIFYSEKYMKKRRIAIQAI